MMDRFTVREFIHNEYEEQAKRNINLFLQEKKKPNYEKFVIWYHKRHPKLRVISKEEFDCLIN